MAALKAKHLGPVQHDSSLLTPAEAKAYQADLGTLKLNYTGRYKKLETQVNQIDGTLRKHPDDVRKLVAPSEQYQQQLDSFANLPDHVREAKIAQLPEPPLMEVDPSTLEDARALADGLKPDFSASCENDFKEVVREMDTTYNDIGRALKRPKSKDWEQKRHEVLIDSLIIVLEKLAKAPEVRIESSLTKGYGADNWTISTRMHHDLIGEERDNKLMETFTALEELLKRLYPERFEEDGRGLVAHSRPLQRGYGDFDCESLRILGPSYELRELLKEAASENLDLRNKKNGAPKLAR